MADSLPTPGDRPVVISNPLSVLTTISLAFNGLILLLILIGIIHHHHWKMKQGAAGFAQREPYAEDGSRGMQAHHPGFGGRPGLDRDGGGQTCEGDQEESHDFGGWRHGPRPEEGPGDGMNRGFGGGERPGSDGWGGHRFGEFGGGFEGPGPRANGSEGSEEMTDRLMLHLAQMLSLTDQQSSQIRTIVQQQITQFQKDMASARQGHEKMIDDAKAKIRPILNADQQKQFDVMMARFGTPAPPSPPAAPAGK